jgi:hypothetical protein
MCVGFKTYQKQSDTSFLKLFLLSILKSHVTSALSVLQRKHALVCFYPNGAKFDISGTRILIKEDKDLLIIIY